MLSSRPGSPTPIPGTLAAPAPLPSLSAFLPAHDEEENLRPMAEAMLEVLADVARRFELVIVDDGSTDRTGALADALARAHPDVVRVIHHRQNRGYGAAVTSGLAAARHQFVFFTDADRQFRPAELRTLIAHLERADMVAGYRVARADPLPRRLTGAAWSWLVRRLLGIPLRDVNCAFKLIRRSALDGMALESRGATVSAELVALVARRGGRIVEVPVAHHPRSAGVPSGGDARVALRALVELAALWRRLRA